MSLGVGVSLGVGGRYFGKWGWLLGGCVFGGVFWGGGMEWLWGGGGGWSEGMLCVLGVVCCGCNVWLFCCVIRQLLVGESAIDPFSVEMGIELFIKIDGGFVPVQNLPVKLAAAGLQGYEYGCIK